VSSVAHKNRDCLAARVRCIDQRSHHRAEIAAGGVGRQHADDSHAGGLHLAARHGQIERE